MTVSTEQLADIVGGNHVRRLEDGNPSFSEAHPRPSPMAWPGSEDEVRDILRLAARNGCGVVPVGGDTAPRIPNEPGPVVLLSLARFAQIDHAVDDLVLTAGAGTTFAAAEAAVAAHGHRLPFSPPRRDRSTLGGIVACAAEGATLNAYGAVRDQVLGIRVVHGDSRASKAGGRVVKNVTGYDLCRLHTGARGALGVITEITLRLRHAEPSACRVLWRFPTIQAAWEAGMTLRQRHHHLFALHALDPLALEKAEGEGAGLVATLRGAEGFVEVAGEALWAEDLPATSRIILPPDAIPVIDDPAQEAGSWLRMGVLPTAGGPLLDTLQARLPSSARIVLDILTGLCDVTHPDQNWLDPTEETALGGDLEPLAAQVDRPGDPGFHLRRFSLFPSTRPDGMAIMDRIVHALDPEGILNPGRRELAG